MTRSQALPVVTGSANPFRELTAVRDGDGYVIGSPRSPDYLAVPEIGGHVVKWLRAGYELNRCAELAKAAAGQTVDVAGFVAALNDAGLLPEETSATDDAGPVKVRGQRIGKFFFGPVGLVIQLAFGLAAVVLLLSTPDLRPTFEDGFIVESPLPAMLLLAAVGTATGLLHEVAHQLAAARYGVRSRISVSRRLFVIVYQTDLTGLWGLSRRQRTVPISAGMISDAAILGLLLLAALYLLEGTPPPSTFAYPRTDPAESHCTGIPDRSFHAYRCLCTLRVSHQEPQSLGNKGCRRAGNATPRDR